MSNIIQTTNVSTKQKEELKRWEELKWHYLQEAPKQVESAAKALATMVTFCLPLFLKFFEDVIMASTSARSLAIIATFAWLGTLALTLLVFYPRKENYAAADANGLKEAYQANLERKKGNLFKALLLFALGLVCMLLPFFMKMLAW